MHFNCVLWGAALAGVDLHGLVRVRLGAAAALGEFFHAAVLREAR